MKTLFSLIIFAFALTLYSFRSTDSDYPGKYGVTNSSHILLDIRENHEFQYTDFSNPENPIDVKGHWVIQNNHLILEHKRAKEFHSKWKLDKSGHRIKSRKGITFYTLGKL